MDYLSAVSSRIRSERRLRRRPRRASLLFYSQLSPTKSPTQVILDNLNSIEGRRVASLKASLHVLRLPSQATSTPSVPDKVNLCPRHSESARQRLAFHDSHPGRERSNASEPQYSALCKPPPQPASPPPVRIVVTEPQSPENCSVPDAHYIKSPVIGSSFSPFHGEFDDPKRASHTSFPGHPHEHRRSPDPRTSTTITRRPRRRRKSAARSSGSLDYFGTLWDGDMDRAPIDPQIMRLRSLNAEVNLLRMELAEWKTKFEERMAEATTFLNDGDSAWRDKARRLEVQLEATCLKVRELEYENEIQAMRLRDAEALSQTNRNLEKRIDVLTELLAQSPTSPSRLYSATSPGGAREPWSPSTRRSRLARPKSMLSYMPVSPPHENNSLQPLVVPETSSAQQDAILQDNAVDVTECPSDRGRRPRLGRTIAQAPPDLSSTDSHSETSASGLTTLKSQRSSMTSQSSLASAWSLPFPFSPDDSASKGSRSRKMRHFPSGSCTLKPLILPAAAANLPDHLFSPPANTRSTAASEPASSLDPTTAFLDEQVYDNPQTHAAHAIWAQKESLAALEGRTRVYQSFEAALTEHAAVAHSFQSESSPIHGLGLGIADAEAMNGTSSMGQARQKTDCTRFDTIARGTGSPPIVEVPSPFDSKNSCVSDAALLKPTYDYCAKTPRWRQLRSAATRSTQIQTGKASNGRVTGKRSSSVGPRPVPTVSILATYSNYLNALPQGPFALLHRLVQRAKGSSWGKLWNLPWWLLGLFLRPKFREKPIRTPRTVEVDNYDWHRFSVASYQAGSAPYTGHQRGPADVSSIQALGDDDDDDDDHDDAAAVIARAFDVQDLDDPPEVLLTNSSSISRSVYWWTRLSLAIVLAVRIAVRDGPETLLKGPRPTRCCGMCHNRSKDPPRPALAAGRSEAFDEQLDAARHSAWAPILSFGGFTVD